MQRKRRYLLLALIPLAVSGAMAAGLITSQWDLPAWMPATTALNPEVSSKAATERTASKSEIKAELSDANTEKDGPATRSGHSGQMAPPGFSIDIARIIADGNSVIAGTADPNTTITIFADGQPVGSATADQNGEWVLITPHKFASLDPKLEVRRGDLMAPRVAALASSTAPGFPSIGETGRPSTLNDGTSAPRRTAAEITRDMIRRIERLTSEANTKRAPASMVSANGSDRSNSGTAAQSAASRANAPNAAAVVQQEAAPSKTAALSQQQMPVSGPALEGARTTETLAVPVQFVYREATFTKQGEKAAELLLNYFKAKDFSSVELSGHADERGTPSANHALSEQRLRRIEQYLRDGGFDGDLKLVPKGETEKFSGVDRSQFPKEELYQLDRRVEVISAR